MPGRMSDFTQLALECNVPATIVALLGSFDASLLARSGTSVQEQEDFITHFIDAASITDVAEKFLARASLRLLYSKCRLAIPSLESPPAATARAGRGSRLRLRNGGADPTSAFLVVARKRFEEDYPTELLDSDLLVRPRKQAAFQN